MTAINPPIYEITYWAANYAIRSVYAGIIVLGKEYVKKHGLGILVPLLCSSSYFHSMYSVTRLTAPSSTHSNMIVDPALLIITTPHKRQNHYWAKSSLWKHPFSRFIFNGLGAVPVNRAGGNNDVLYADTIDMLCRGEVMGVFPEGTSYTLPHMTAFKDGLARAALQYAKYARDNVLPPASIVPVGFNYTQKERWRSAVIVQYGQPVSVEYLLAEYETDPKSAVKKLSKIILDAVMKQTINSPDWESLHAAVLARKLCIPSEYFDMSEHVHVSQSDLSSHLLVTPCKKLLLQYHNLLKRHALRDIDIVRYLQPTMASSSITPLMLIFFATTTRCIVQLPLLIPGTVMHAPLHILVQWLTRKEIFKECYAQTMSLTVLALLPVLYSFYAVIITMAFGLFSRWWFIFMVVMVLVAATYMSIVDDRLPMIYSFKSTFTLFRLALSETGRSELKQLRETRIECYHALSSLFVPPEEQLTNGSPITENTALRIPITFTENSFHGKYATTDKGNSKTSTLPFKPSSLSNKISIPLRAPAPHTTQFPPLVDITPHSTSSKTLLNLSKAEYDALPYGPFQPVNPLPLNAPKGDYPIPISIKMTKNINFAAVMDDIKVAWWRWHNVRYVWQAVDEEGWPVVQDGKSWYNGTKIWIQEEL